MQHAFAYFVVRRTLTRPCILTACAVLLAALPGESFGDEAWDVIFDGVDSAADNVPNHLRWDSAIDDDWDDPGLSFWLNTPSPGFMTVDRVTNPADHIKTGNIWVRDPILSHADGFTMEVGVRIEPNSNQDAFSMTYLDDGGSFGVHLSPNQIKAGNLAAGGAGVTTAFDTTDDFHTYRIVKQPNSHAISVYVDGNTTPIITGNGDSGFAVGSSPFLQYPRVLIGDNENNPIYNANYVMDFARFRRGATAPGETPPVLPPRVLPPLPSPAPPPGAPAVPVWESTFDATADGVVDIFDQNAGKAMIGPVSGGRLQVETWDNSTDAFFPDKAGRPLGTTLSGDSSMSAQYKFNWSQLNTDQTQAYEAIGFLGQSQSGAPQTRQLLGSILRHWKVGNDFYAAVDVGVGGVGFTSFGYLAGSGINLGPNALTNDYEFRIQYDGTTHELGLELLNDQGALLGGQSVDLDIDVPGLQQFGTPAQELGSLSLTHLGWSDYTGNGGDRATVWQVDSLTFDNTATGAFNPGVETGEVWMVGYDGIGQPSASGWMEGGGSGWTQQPDGIMELNTLASPSNARMDTVSGWPNQAGITLEARIKVMPDSEEAGFNLVANDQLGDMALVLSPDKVELMQAHSPVGQATVTMDTTDDFHVYRLTRDVDGLYWHLYIDDNPVAAIEHQHAGGTLLNFSRIWFGDVAFPIPDNGGHVLIDYIRWHEGGNAPLTPLLGDANNDGQVTGADLIAVQQNFGNTGPDDGTLLGDANDDGQVTGADLIAVQQNFGNVQSDAQGPGTPEPGTLNGLLLSALIVCQLRRRGARRQKDHL